MSCHFFPLVRCLEMMVPVGWFSTSCNRTNEGRTNNVRKCKRRKREKSSVKMFRQYKTWLQWESHEILFSFVSIFLPFISDSFLHLNDSTVPLHSFHFYSLCVGLRVWYVYIFLRLRAAHTHTNTLIEFMNMCEMWVWLGARPLFFF